MEKLNRERMESSIPVTFKSLFSLMCVVVYMKTVPTSSYGISLFERTMACDLVIVGVVLLEEVCH